MKTELDFLLQMQYEFDTSEYGEGTSVNLSGMSQRIHKRIKELQKQRDSQIVLTFDASNNYDTVSSEDAHVLNARWLVNCALEAIEKVYEKGAPRRVEMEGMHADLMNQINKQTNNR